MKKFIRKIFEKTGAGAPDPPRQITLDRRGIDEDLYEGQQLQLWLKTGTLEIRAYPYEDSLQDEYVGISHNYALARYIMQFGNPPVRIDALSNSEIIATVMYGRERKFDMEAGDDDFV